MDSELKLVPLDEKPEIPIDKDEAMKFIVRASNELRDLNLKLTNTEEAFNQQKNIYESKIDELKRKCGEKVTLMRDTALNSGFFRVGKYKQKKVNIDFIPDCELVDHEPRISYELDEKFSDKEEFRIMYKKKEEVQLVKKDLKKFVEEKLNSGEFVIRRSDGTDYDEAVFDRQGNFQGVMVKKTHSGRYPFGIKPNFEEH